MLVEAMIFRSEERAQHHHRDFGQADGTEVFARPFTGARQHFAFERGSGQGLIVAQHARDTVAPELEPQTIRALSVPATRPGVARLTVAAQRDVPRAGSAPELTRPRGRGPRLDVFQPGESAGEIDRAHADAGDERLPGRVDERRAPGISPGEASELDRGVGQEGCAGHSDDHHDDGGGDREDRSDAAASPHDSVCRGPEALRRAARRRFRAGASTALTACGV